MDNLNEFILNMPEFTSVMKIFLMMTVFMFLPTIIFMMTSFVRIIISFSFIKAALGAQQTIPNQILIGLALCITMFIMSPVVTEINDTALKPYFSEEISTKEMVEKASIPIREFLLEQTRKEDLDLFIQNSGIDAKNLDKNEIPLNIVIPAFAISELKTAFQIGFLIYIPFIIIDFVVSSVLMSMGMFMLPPAMISLPIKLLVFIMVDGWNLLVKSLILSFSR